MAVVVVELAVDNPLNVSKLLNFTRNGDRTLVMKSIFFFSLLQQLHEQRVVQVDQWHHKSLVFLWCLPYFHCQAPSWDLILFRLTHHPSPLLYLE